MTPLREATAVSGLTRYTWADSATPPKEISLLVLRLTALLAETAPFQYRTHK